MKRLLHSGGFRKIVPLIGVSAALSASQVFFAAPAAAWDFFGDSLRTFPAGGTTPEGWLNRASIVSLPKASANEADPSCGSAMWLYPSCTTSLSNPLDGLGDWHVRFPFPNFERLTGTSAGGGQGYKRSLGLQMMAYPNSRATTYNNPKANAPFAFSGISAEITLAKIKKEEGQELKMGVQWTIDGWNSLRWGETVPAPNPSDTYLWVPVRAGNSNSGPPNANAGEICADRRTSGRSGRNYSQYIDTDWGECDVMGGAHAGYFTDEGGVISSSVNIGDFPDPIKAFLIVKNSVVALIKCPRPTSSSYVSCEWSYPSIYANLESKGYWMPWKLLPGVGGVNWYRNNELLWTKQWDQVRRNSMPSYSNSRLTTTWGSGGSQWWYQLTIARQAQHAYKSGCRQLAGLASQAPVSGDWPNKRGSLNFLKGCLVGPHSPSESSSPTFSRFPSPANLRFFPTTSASATPQAICNSLSTDDRRLVAEAIERHEPSARRSLDCL